MQYWKDVATVVQSISVAIAVIIGGMWALFRFRVLNEQARASAELDRLRYELERRSTLKVTLVTAVTPTVATLATKCITIIVTLENSGTKTEAIDWGRAGLSVFKVNGFQRGAPVLESVVTLSPLVKSIDLVTTYVEPGESVGHAFLTQAPTAGLYLLEFFAHHAEVNAAAVEELRRTARPHIKDLSNPVSSFSASVFVLVPEDSGATASSEPHSAKV